TKKLMASSVSNIPIVVKLLQLINFLRLWPVGLLILPMGLVVIGLAWSTWGILRPVYLVPGVMSMKLRKCWLNYGPCLKKRTKKMVSFYLAMVLVVITI